MVTVDHSLLLSKSDEQPQPTVVNRKTVASPLSAPPVTIHSPADLCYAPKTRDSVHHHVSSSPLQSLMRQANIRIKTDLDAIPTTTQSCSGKPGQQQTAIGIEILKPQPRPGGTSYIDDMSSLVTQVQKGLLARVSPIPVDDCTGGVYYLRTKSHRLAAVFKPADEEAYAPNSPKTFQRPEMASKCSSMRQGIAPGDAAVREVAAYLLDHAHFAKVPATALASAFHPGFHYHESSPACVRKLGALQAYVPHKCTADDMGYSLFNTADIHAMAILDIRLANQDRHGGNVLVVESTSSRFRSPQLKQFGLVPIDHGACLPRVPDMSETSFLWLFWPQAKEPFSSTELAYIAALDAHKDLQLLQSSLPIGQDLEWEAKLTLLVCTTLLQFCALERRMTAHSIGLLMCRQGTARQYEMKPSTLEELVTLASRDPVVLKHERLWKAQEKGHVSISSAKTATHDKAWDCYAINFVAAFRRELAAYFAAKETDVLSGH